MSCGSPLLPILDVLTFMCNRNRKIVAADVFSEITSPPGLTTNSGPFGGAFGEEIDGPEKWYRYI
jgi:hypothetical protein